MQRLEKTHRERVAGWGWAVLMPLPTGMGWQGMSKEKAFMLHRRFRYPLKKLFIPRSVEDIMRYVRTLREIGNDKVLIHLSSNLGVSGEIISLLIENHAGFLRTTSRRNLNHRVSKLFKSTVSLCELPVGQMLQWTSEAKQFAASLLERGESLGYICGKLYEFYEITINTKGLQKWRWGDIKGGPPQTLFR